MKFGITFEQRSVPQFAPYNVNYNELKTIIKSRTVPESPSDPIVIRGLGNAQDNRWNTLEDDLFPLLYREFERASNFIRVKYGELDRRLSYLERQFKRLQRDDSTLAYQRPLDQTRRFQRLVQSVHELGDDIQALIRFSGAQRTAFRKILKKYKKWTGSATLEQRCRSSFFSQTDALQPDMTGYLDRLAQVSASITKLTRSNAPARNISRLHRPGVNLPSVIPPAKVFKDVLDQSKSPLDLDVALDFTPLGKSAGRAVYWIHTDHLEEANVLLQRYMRQTYPPAPFHQILFDNLGRFVQEMNATPIAQLDDGEGITPTKVAMTARWNADDAIVSLSDISNGSRVLPKSVHVKRKDVPKIMKREPPESCPSEVRDYLTLHRDVKPLAAVTSQRSTFCGYTNSAEVGNWATLDTGISAGNPGSFDTKAPERERLSFPHGVLEIRWEFSPMPEIVRALDSGHLVERIRGFSLEEYAIFAVCRPENATLPIWQPTLQKDIRKLSLNSAPRLKGSTSFVRQSTTGSSTEGQSDEVFSANVTRGSDSNPYTPATSITDFAETAEPTPIKPEKPTAKHRNHDPARHPRPAIQRYWNEFDDGSEADNDSYAIYVQPDEPFELPGAEAMSKALAALRTSLSRGKSRVVSWLNLEEKKGPSERDSLLGHRDAEAGDMEDSSSSSSSDDTVRGHVSRKEARVRTVSGGGTAAARAPALVSVWLRSRHRVRRLKRNRERALFRAYAGLIALGYFLLAVSRVIRAVGRKSAAFEVAGGIVACAVLAEACAVLAVALLVMRRGRSVGVAHKMGFGVVVAGVVIWGAAVLVSVGLGGKR